LFHIKQVLGFGNVRYDKNVNAHRYVVSDLSSLVKLAHLFNGNLFLIHRINQLKNWLLYLETKNIKINHIEKPINISINNA
jgi:hypothetical protein